MSYSLPIRLRAVLAFFSAVVLATSGCNSNSPSNKTEVKIGAILPLTGEVANWGEDSSHAIDLAVEQANQSSNKYVYRVVYEDSKGKGAEAVAAARKLINVDKVVAIIGDDISGPTIAMVPIADSAKIPICSPSASSPKLTGMSKYFFRVYPSDTAEGTFMANVAASDLGLKKVAILFVTNEFGTGLRDIFTSTFTAKGGTIVEALGYNEDETDFRPYLTKVKAANPDGVYLAGYYKDGGALLRQAKEVGIKARFLGSTTHEDPQLISIAQDAANGLIYPYSTGYDEKSMADPVVKFQQAYKTKFGVPPGLVSAVTYDCITLTISAIEKNGPTGEAVRSTFASTRAYPGTAGEITFDDNGDVHKPILLKTVQDGKFVPMQKAQSAGAP